MYLHGICVKELSWLTLTKCYKKDERIESVEADDLDDGRQVGRKRLYIYIYKVNPK